MTLTVTRLFSTTAHDICLCQTGNSGSSSVASRFRCFIRADTIAGPGRDELSFTPYMENRPNGDATVAVRDVHPFPGTSS